jgi:putative DNA primase/helicase
MDVDAKPEHRNMAASRMNQISGEDSISAERKNIGIDWNGQLPGRLWLWGNTLPNFGAATVAMVERLITWPFRHSFKHRQDRKLSEKLYAELPSILNWALAGLARLRERGDFPKLPPACQQMNDALLHRHSPIVSFISECTKVTPRASVVKDELCYVFDHFLMHIGVHPVARQTLTSKLEEMHSVADARRARHPKTGERVPIYRGIRLNDEMMIKHYEHDPVLVQVCGGRCMESLKRDPDTNWPIFNAATRDFEP